MQKLIYFIIIAILANILFIYPSVAKEDKINEPTKHKLLQRLVDEKNLKALYLGQSYGLDGWILKNKEDNKVVQYVYTTSEGGLITGLLFGPEGEIVTFRQIKEMLGKNKELKLASTTSEKEPPSNNDSNNNQNNELSDVDKSQILKKYQDTKHKINNKDNKQSNKSKKFYAETEKSNWVAIGNKNAPYIYMYMNPNCIHCKDFWNDIKQAVNNNQLQIRMIPFGKVDINKHAGAALLSVLNPTKAWGDFVGGNKKALDKSLAKKESYKKIKENTKLFAKWKLPSSPFIVYMSPSSGKVTVIAGRPENTLLLLAEFVQ